MTSKSIEKNNTKMLQLILNGQAEIKKELKETKELLGKKIDRNSIKLDRLHDSHMYQEDDTPTKKEFKKLVKRVEKLETKIAAV